MRTLGAGAQLARNLARRTVLHVGGRARQIPQSRAIVERAGARFLHHDGGVEDNPALLAGLVSRADMVFFPIDCVSHDAVGTVKRLCRQMGKHYEPLRSASLAALLPHLTASAQTQRPDERTFPRGEDQRSTARGQLHRGAARSRAPASASLHHAPRQVSNRERLAAFRPTMTHRPSVAIAKFALF
jgi:hypothetical protein